MRVISLDKVTGYMKLARSIYRANGEMLLSQGTVLTSKYVQRLKDFGCESVTVYDGLLNDVTFDEVISEKTRLQALKCLESLENNVKKCRPINVGTVKKVVSNIVDEVLQNKEIMLNMSNILSYDEYTFDHSVNVTVTSVMIGMSLYYTREKLVDLGMGVILHDVGKTLVPAEILNKPGKLTNDEYEIIKQHTWHGFKLLKGNPDVKLTSAHVALQHHERFNGSGYPRGLKGKRALEFARICAIADVFDAMTNDRCYRAKIPVHKVYDHLIAKSGIDFDPVILDSFVQKIAIFPKGTKVLLSDGRSGFVIKQNYMSPFKPVIRLFWENDINLSRPVEVDLLHEERLCIADVIED